jgi:hypothetical protein
MIPSMFGAAPLMRDVMPLIFAAMKQKATPNVKLLMLSYSREVEL